MKPKRVDDPMVAFPANLGDMLPKWEDIPEIYKRGSTKWHRVFHKWFYEGIKGNFVCKDGIDSYDAVRHIKCIVGSYEPKYEHKEAAAAYLMDLWFVNFVEDKNT